MLFILGFHGSLSGEYMMHMKLHNISWDTCVPMFVYPMISEGQLYIVYRTQTQKPKTQRNYQRLMEMNYNKIQKTLQGFFY